MVKIRIKNKTGKDIKSVTVTNARGDKRTIESKDFNREKQQKALQRKLRRESTVRTRFA